MPCTRGLALRPFVKPAPTRQIGVVWRRTHPRQQAIEAVARLHRRSKRYSSRAAAAGTMPTPRHQAGPRRAGHTLRCTPALTTPATPYDHAAALGSTRLEALFAAGEQRELLHGLFGAEACAELHALALAARASRQRRPHGRPRAWLLPGIMGTRLGFARAAGAPADAVRSIHPI